MTEQEMADVKQRLISKLTDSDEVQAGERFKVSKLKDSGERTQFDSGAVRDLRSGKGMPCLVPVLPMLRVEKHFEAGRIKYSNADSFNIGEENWKKGIPLMCYYDSAKRHLDEWRRGDISEDKLAAACWNILCLMETERRVELGILPTELDNRDKNELPQTYRDNFKID